VVRVLLLAAVELQPPQQLLLQLLLPAHLQWIDLKVAAAAFAGL
jgi:hypothetical protein